MVRRRIRITTPEYWESMKWVDGWHPESPDADPEIDGIQTGYLKRHGPHSSTFKSIAKYLKLSIAAGKAAPKGEATRVSRAKWQLQGVLDDLADDGLTHEKRALLETRRDNLMYTASESKIPFRGSKPPKPGPAVIKKIKAVKHDDLWKAYFLRRRRLARLVGEHALKRVEWTVTEPDTGLPVLDAELGEALLVHGTTPAAIKAIVANGFDPAFSGPKNKCVVCEGSGETDDDEACETCGGTGTRGIAAYGALGQGTYFTDNFGKAMTYTTCPMCYAFRCQCIEEDGQPVCRTTMLARVQLGRPHSVRTQASWTQSIGKGGKAAAARHRDATSIKEGRHSIYGKKRGLHLLERPSLFGANEFCIKEASQMYPEFVVYWHWPIDH